MGLNKSLQKDIVRATLVQSLGTVLRRKLADSGAEIPADVVAALVDHLLSGKAEPFRWDGSQEDVVLHLDEADWADVVRELDEHVGRLPLAVERAVNTTANLLVRHLKKRWPEQDAWERASRTGFQQRLEDRWGDGLSLLRLLLVVCREIGDQRNQRRMRSKARRNLHLRDATFRLHARSCQVTEEIITLMEHGFADGAMARWRTLHEIHVVMGVIDRFGDPIAERYLLHQVVDSKRASDLFARTSASLGYAPPLKRDARLLDRQYVAVVAKFGPDFGGAYGWAAHHLNIKQPRFSDLEAAAGIEQLRSHYKMASYNVHAGSKGIAFRLGLLDQGAALLAGPSNAGLSEPGQNTAITLARITTLLVGQRPQLDDAIQLRTLAMLSQQAVRAFVAAERKLAKDEARLAETNNARGKGRKLVASKRS